MYVLSLNSLQILLVFQILVSYLYHGILAIERNYQAFWTYWQTVYHLCFYKVDLNLTLGIES